VEGSLVNTGNWGGSEIFKIRNKLNGGRRPCTLTTVAVQERSQYPASMYRLSWMSSPVKGWTRCQHPLGVNKQFFRVMMSRAVFAPIRLFTGKHTKYLRVKLKVKPLVSYGRMSWRLLLMYHFLTYASVLQPSCLDEHKATNSRKHVGPAYKVLFKDRTNTWNDVCKKSSSVM
jgi:hypothetical protein